MAVTRPLSFDHHTISPPYIRKRKNTGLFSCEKLWKIYKILEL